MYSNSFKPPMKVKFRNRLLKGRIFKLKLAAIDRMATL
jgi:hypothetical protein